MPNQAGEYLGGFAALAAGLLAAKGAQARGEEDKARQVTAKFMEHAFNEPDSEKGAAMINAIGKDIEKHFGKGSSEQAVQAIQAKDALSKRLAERTQDYLQGQKSVQGGVRFPGDVIPPMGRGIGDPTTGSPTPSMPGQPGIPQTQGNTPTSNALQTLSAARGMPDAGPIQQQDTNQPATPMRSLAQATQPQAPAAPAQAAPAQTPQQPNIEMHPTFTSEPSGTPRQVWSPTTRGTAGIEAQKVAALQEFSAGVVQQMRNGVKDPQEAARNVITANPKLYSFLDANERQQIFGGSGKEPPALTPDLQNSILAKANTGLPFTKRELDAAGVSSNEDMKRLVTEIKANRQQEFAQQRSIAAASARAGRADEPLGKPVLDAKTGEQVNLTKGDYLASPKAYIVMTPMQEKIKGAWDTAKNHMLVTSDFLDALPTRGIRASVALREKVGIQINDPNSVAVLSQMGAMSSLATGGALTTAGGGRGANVRLAEFMKPANVEVGDSLAVAIKKMQVWMKLGTANLKDAGLPTIQYKNAIDKLNDNIGKRLLEETHGNVAQAKALSKELGLGF